MVSSEQIALDAIGSDLRGLSSADARERLRLIGPNVFARRRRAAAVLEILRIGADPMALMLAAAAAVYFALGETTDAVVLLVALVPVLGVDVILEARSRTALSKLASAVAPRVRVIRDGVEVEIATRDLVPGDIMLVAEGSVVHADATLKTAANLSVDEAQLTGEAEPVAKTPAPNGLDSTSSPADSRVYAGSRVLAGHGWAEVIATGERSRFGNIARLVAETEEPATPLQKKTARLARWLIASAAIVSSALFVLWIARGVPASRAMLYAISVAMSAVSEEFVLVLTLFLSLGAWRLSRIGVLVRRLASVETLGATTVICLDKTGTLTAGDYALTTHLPFHSRLSETELLEAAVLACEPNPADSMERTIVAHCAEHQVDVDAIHARWKLVYDHAFDPIGKHMSHVWRARDHRPNQSDRIVAKGALEGVLEHCALTTEERARASEENAQLAAQGMRVLAVAGRETAAGQPQLSGNRIEDEQNLRLYGLLGFQDPMRPAVPAAVAECQAAGIRLKLITGDHALTAHAIADAAGLAHENDGIVTGDELDDLSGEAFTQTVRRCAIFARVRPEQKFAIVDALQRAGEVVAMTGDGINDAPALKRADIGVSMGRRATEVARSVAGLVLLEDDFAAMVETIREGREIYSNIQRAFMYLTGFKVMLIAMAVAAPLAGFPILLLPVNLVWLELIVHPVSALAFEGEAADANVMRRPPRDPRAAILQPADAMRSAMCGAMLAVGAIVVFALRLPHGEVYARSVAMVVAVGGSLMLVWASLAGRRAWWRVPAPRSAKFWLVILGVGATLPIFMRTGPLAAILMIAPIELRDWAIALAIAVIAVSWTAFGISTNNSELIRDS